MTVPSVPALAPLPLPYPAKDLQSFGIRRAVVVFPEFENGEILHRIRRHYDPLVESVPLLLTVLAPFVARLAGEALESHLQSAAAAVEPFPMRLQGIVGTGTGLICLRARRGADELRQLHERLRGIVSSPPGTPAFLPHLRIGRLASRRRLQATVRQLQDFEVCFETRVREISAVSFDPGMALRRECAVALGATEH